MNTKKIIRLWKVKKMNQLIHSMIFKYIDKEMNEINIDNYNIIIIDDNTLEVQGVSWYDGSYYNKVYCIESIKGYLITMKINENNGI